MRIVTYLFSATLFAACTLPNMFSGGGGATQSSHTTTSSTEEMGGEPLEPGEPEAPQPPTAKKKKVKPKDKYEDFGATCKKNKDCDSNTCFVGRGDLGYCTVMCNSFSDCPSHWDCKRAGNAPQKICIQD